MPFVLEISQAQKHIQEKKSWKKVKEIKFLCMYGAHRNKPGFPIMPCTFFYCCFPVYRMLFFYSTHFKSLLDFHSLVNVQLWVNKQMGSSASESKYYSFHFVRLFADMGKVRLLHHAPVITEALVIFMLICTTCDRENCHICAISYFLTIELILQSRKTCIGAFT